MSISLKVLAPNKNVYQGEAEEVILPSTTGQLGVLPGHISLVTAIDIGVLRLRMNSQWKSIALMGGFAEIESDEVIVLVNNAEIGSEINVQNAEQDLKEAKLAISKFSENEKNPEKIKLVFCSLDSSLGFRNFLKRFNFLWIFFIFREFANC